jgi:hypothetical protein
LSRLRLGFTVGPMKKRTTARVRARPDLELAKHEELSDLVTPIRMRLLVLQKKYGFDGTEPEDGDPSWDQAKLVNFEVYRILSRWLQEAQKLERRYLVKC